MSQEARARIEDHLLPRDFVASRRHGHDAFMNEFGDTQLLLIQIDDPESELAQGLAGASTVSGLRLKPTYDGLGFATVMHSGPEEAPKSVRPPSHHFDTTTLETLLVRNCYFVAPLRRRNTGRAFVEHISVGRARNSDIVLRHDSVSKFHAWFECDEEGRFYVGDAKSKNGTKVNGVRVLGSDLAPLTPGDEIRFGRVSSVICTPETFWRAIAA